MATRNLLTRILLVLIATPIITYGTNATSLCHKANACYKSLTNDGHLTLDSQDSAENAKKCISFERCVFSTATPTDDPATAINNTDQSNNVSQTSQSLSELICTCSLIGNEFLLEESSSSLCKTNQTTDGFKNAKACKRHAHLCLMISEYMHEHVTNHNPKYCDLLLQCVSITTIDLDRLRNMMKFPERVPYYNCPYNDFCLIRSRYEHRINQCSSCSCDYDCGNTRSCCYPDLDTYHIAEDPTMVCHEVTIGYRRKSFLYMVSTCNDGSRCNLTTVAPASSLTTNRIYINADCAKCNCVHDYTIWDSGIWCSFILTEKIQDLLADIRFTSRCYDLLSPPDDHTDLIKRLGCPNGLSSGCFYFYDTVDLQKECNMTWAPLFSNANPGKLYRNPSCALCNGDLKEVKKTSFPITAIFNRDVLNAYRTSQRNREKCISHQGVCRRIICPVATVRVDLTCQYVYTQWREVTLSVQFRLHPLGHNHVFTQYKLEEISHPELHKWLHPKCDFKFPQSGNLVHVYMQDLNSNSKMSVKQIQILAVYTEKNIVPQNFITTLKTCLQTNWEIKLIDGKTYSYSVQLAGTGSINHEDEMNELTLDNPSGTTGELFRDTHKTLSNTATNVQTELFVVTKFFFCEQIKLASFEVKQDGGHIVLLHNKKRLRKGEYKMIKIKTGDVTEDFYVIVCIEDFLCGAQKSRAHAQLFSASLTIVLSGVLTFYNTDVSLISN